MSGTFRVRRGEFGAYTRWTSSDDMHTTMRTLGFTYGVKTKPLMDMAVESLFSKGCITLTKPMVQDIVKNLGKNKVNTLIYSRVKEVGDHWVIPAKLAKDPKVYKQLKRLMVKKLVN